MSEFEPSNFDKSEKNSGLHAERDLCDCPVCPSSLVQPTDWEEASETHWLVALRCPDCEWADTEVFTQRQCVNFQDALDVGTGVLVKALRQLIHENESEEIARFSYALQNGHILPEDF